MKRSSDLSLVVLFILTAIAFAMRLVYLLHSHPFIDEFTTVLAARAILQRGLPLLPSGLFYEHGVLFTYLDAPFVGLARQETLFTVARLPSLLIGVATVPLLYWLGRRWLSPLAGLIAAALLALSPEGMVWGGRARMYALAQLLVLLLTFFVFEGSRERERSRLRWLALLTLLATLLAQFGAMILVPPLVVAGLVVAWLSRPEGERPWFLRRSVLLEGVGLVGVLGVAVLIKRLGQPLGADPLGSEGAKNLFTELVGTITYQASLALDGENAIKFLTRQFGVPHHVWLTAVAVVGGFLWLALWISAHRRARRHGKGSMGQIMGKSANRQFSNLQSPYFLLPTPYSLLFLWLVFGLTVVEMVTLLEPFRRNPRYLVMALPLFYLIVAGQLSNFKFKISNLKSPILIGHAVPKGHTVPKGHDVPNLKPMVFGLSLAVFAVVQIALLIPDLRIACQTPEPAYEDAFQYVAAHWQEGDVVLTMNPFAAALYLDRVDYFAMQEDTEQFLLNVDGELVDRWLGAPWIGTAADLNRVLDEHSRAWFVVDTIRLPVYYRGDWLSVLATQMDLVWSEDEALVYRTRPDREPLPTAPGVRVDAELGGLIRLVGYTEVTDETSYRPTFFWTALSPISADYTVFVHVRDSSGATVAQRDSQPVGGDYPTSQWRVGETVIDPYVVELPADLPPGEYQILVGMYQLETLERLQVVEDTSGENAVVLGEVTLP